MLEDEENSVASPPLEHEDNRPGDEYTEETVRFNGIFCFPTFLFFFSKKDNYNFRISKIESEKFLNHYFEIRPK